MGLLRPAHPRLGAARRRRPGARGPGAARAAAPASRPPPAGAGWPLVVGVGARPRRAHRLPGHRRGLAGARHGPAGAGRRRRRGPAVGAGAALSTAVPRYLGRISYAWYLWHWPCLVLLAGVGRSREGDRRRARSGAHGRHRLPAARRRSRTTSSSSRVRRAAAGSRTRRHGLLLGARAHRAGRRGDPAAPPRRGARCTAGGDVVGDADAAARRARRCGRPPPQARGDLPTGSGGLLPAARGHRRWRSAGSRRAAPDGRPPRRLARRAVAPRRCGGPRRSATGRCTSSPRSCCPATDVADLVARPCAGRYPACSAWRHAGAAPGSPRCRTSTRSSLGPPRRVRRPVAGPEGDRLQHRSGRPSWAEGTRRTLDVLARPRRPRSCSSSRSRPRALTSRPAVSGAGGRRASAPSPAARPRRAATAVEQAERTAIAGHAASSSGSDLNDRVCPDDPCRVVGPTGRWSTATTST